MNTPNKKTTLLTASVIAFTLGANVYAENTTAKKDQPSMVETTGKKFIDGWREGKIETAYLLNEYLNPFDIDVDVKGSTAYLKGEVKTEIERELAREIAFGIEGINSVKNDIKLLKSEPAVSGVTKVKNSFARAIEDASITASIKTKLINSRSIKSLNIDVDTEDANVLLKGVVGTDQEKELVERIAYNTKGVNSVQNNIAVK